MKKIIFDTDNTIGIEGRPMDDALALMYLLGLPDEAEIIGVTCNYGNGTVNEVYNATRKLLDELDCSDMLVLRGCEIGEDPCTEAARWIANTVTSNPGEVSFLGIGSLSNLYGAYLIDHTVLDNLKEIVLMGGLTEPLYIHGDQPLAELNMSINNIASSCILRNGHDISVITGNNCLAVAEIPKDEFLEKLQVNSNPNGMYIAKSCGYRFRDKVAVYGADSSYCWDAVAAAYLVHPELFDDHLVPCNIDEALMKKGFLNPVTSMATGTDAIEVRTQEVSAQSGASLKTGEEAAGNAVINIPQAKDKNSLQDDFYKGWLNCKVAKTENNFSCNGVYLDKLIQPAILIELAKEPAHGFLLLQRLKDSELIEQNLDPAGFYRMLKKLERADFVISKKTGSSPKARQVYEITDLGRLALRNWHETLTQYREHIDRILDEIEKSNS